MYQVANLKIADNASLTNYAASVFLSLFDQIDGMDTDVPMSRPTKAVLSSLSRLLREWNFLLEKYGQGLDENHVMFVKGLQKACTYDGKPYRYVVFTDDWYTRVVNDGLDAYLHSPFKVSTSLMRSQGTLFFRGQRNPTRTSNFLPQPGPSSTIFRKKTKNLTMTKNPIDKLIYLQRCKKPAPLYWNCERFAVQVEQRTDSPQGNTAAASSNSRAGDLARRHG